MTAAVTRAVPVRHLHARPQAFHYAADAGERARLAERFGLLAVQRLSADVELRRSGRSVSLDGEFSAEVVQACVVSGEPVPASPAGPLHLRFEPPGDAGADIELDADMVDTLPLDGDSIDLAEAVAQSLCLALDPYPRASAAVLRRFQPYLQPEPETPPPAETKRPFAALRVIREDGDSGASA